MDKERGDSSRTLTDKLIRLERRKVGTGHEAKIPLAMVTSPARRSAAPQTQKKARQNHLGKTQPKVGNIAKKKDVIQSIGGKSAPNQHLHLASANLPSSRTSSQTVPSKVPLKPSASEKNISELPPIVDGSPSLPVYHTNSSKDKNDHYSRVYGGAPIRDESLDLEEFAALAKWAAAEREEIRKYFTEISSPPYCRLSQVLEDLGSGAFDEDKYLISRRVDLYIREAYKTAVDSIKKGDNPYSPGPFTDAGVSSSFKHKFFPISISGIPETNMTAATTTSSKSAKKEYHHLFHPHPPPLFAHHWITCTQRSSQVPLSGNQPESVWQTRDDLEAANVSVSKMKRNKKSNSPRDASTESYSSQDQQHEKDYISPEISSLPSSAQLHEQGQNSDKPPLLSANSHGTHGRVDKKSRLQYSHQKGVDIRANLVTENTAGISISPRNMSSYQNERRTALLEVIYAENSEESAREMENGSNQEGSQNSQHDEPTEVRERNSPQQEVQNSPCEDPEIPSHNADEDANSLSAESSETESNGMKKDDEIPVLEDINHHPTNNHNHKFPEQNKYCDVAQETKKCPMQNHHNGNENNNERETLPGYLPEIRWEEVTFENCSNEENDSFSRERLQEAENRLYEHEMRQRILNRLEFRLQHLLENQEHLGRDDLATVEEDLICLSDSADDMKDQQMSMAVEAVRALLTDLVHQRLPLITSQEVAEAQPSLIDHEISSIAKTPCSESSLETNARGTPTPVCTPQSSPRPVLENIPCREQITTPSPSPPPPPVMQDGLLPDKVLTPQLSLEEPDEENEVIATPSTSPPSGRSVIAAYLPRSPATTPRGSPAKVKFKDFSAATPAESPLFSEEEEEEGAASIPVITPSPRKPVDRGFNIPKTPTPSLSPVNLHPEPVVCINTPVEVLSPHETGVPCMDSPRYTDQGTQAEAGERENKLMTHSAIQVHSKYDTIEPTSPETLSVICHSSTDATVSSSVEASDTTYMTLSEGEVRSCELPLNTSIEDGEISRTCNLGMLYSTTRDMCTAHKSASGRILSENQGSQDITKSEGEMQLYENSSSDDTRRTMARLTPDNSQSEDTIQHDQLTISEMSVVQNESYSSGDATAISAEELEALRQENAILMSRLRNLGSLSFLTGSSWSSNVTRGSSTP